MLNLTTTSRFHKIGNNLSLGAKGLLSLNPYGKDQIQGISSLALSDHLM